MPFEARIEAGRVLGESQHPTALNAIAQAVASGAALDISFMEESIKLLAKFRENPKIFLSVCYLVFIVCFLLVSFILEFNMYFYLFFLLVLLHLFFYQIKKFDKIKKNNCLNIFKSNNLLGLLVFLNILISKI